MRLFFQLTEPQKLAATKHCTEIVLRDLISGSVHLEPVSDEDFAVFDTVAAAMLHIESISTQEEKVNYLMSQDIICESIKTISLTMANNCIYLDDDETTIYVNSLEEPEKLLSGPVVAETTSAITEEEIDDMDDEFFDLKTHTVKNKNPYGMN